jgi:predicted permease
MKVNATRRDTMCLKEISLIRIGIVAILISLFFWILWYFIKKKRDETNTDMFKPITYSDQDEYKIIGGVSGLGWIN